MTAPLTLPHDWSWARSLWIDAIPDLEAPDILAYCEKNLRLPGSARSEQFRVAHTPWIREPLEAITRVVVVNGRYVKLRKLTFVKPVQSGGSTLGKAAICYWVEWGQGNILYYWPTNDKADEKWRGEIHKCLKATVGHRFPAAQNRASQGVGFVDFPRGNLWCRGAYQLANVTSDNARYVIKEELHDTEGWLEGRSEQADNRSTAQWSPVILEISNAGEKGGALHQSFDAGTQQHFQVKCPGCKQFHIMRARWDDKHPELGGLRYNADGCRREDGTYDYNRMESSIRFQMPCGFEVRDSPRERRPMALAGNYTEPQNTGAHLSHRSYTLQAVSVDFIPFLNLIQEKHRALKAIRSGDIGPWKTYLRERECIFHDEEDRPSMGRIILVKDAKKTREGLPGRAARFFALDWQRGRWTKGETPHWWLLIRDVMPNGDSMLVWEGKCLTDSDAIGVLDDHECNRVCGAADSSYDPQHVYAFCMANGIHAIKCEGRDKGVSQKEFRHKDGSRRIFSEPTPLFIIAGIENSKYEFVESEEGEMVPDPREPMFWNVSSHGMQERLAWLIGEHHLKSVEGPPVKWEIPEDVSEDYKSHMEGLEWDEEKKGWVEVKPRYDLRWCEGVVAMLAEIARLIGVGPRLEQPQK